MRAFSGVSVAALAAALVASPVLAEDLTGDRNRFSENLVGSSGRDAYHSPWWFIEDHGATAGDAGPARDYTNRGIIGMRGAPGWAVSISSTGGGGGDAAHLYDAAAGGQGGALTFLQLNEIIVGRMNGYSLVSLTSQGGRGGTGTLTSYGGRPGAGGAGGAVTFTQSGRIDAAYNDIEGTLIDLRSNGGRGGSRGGLGGAGGAVTLVQGGTITTAYLLDTGKPLLAMTSTGGNGGGATSVVGAGAGGDGGAVTFVQSGNPIVGQGAQTNGTPLIWLLSQGGEGGSGYVGRPEGGRHDGLLQSSGRGGAGGAVSAIVNGVVRTEGTKLAAIRATSKGGDGGLYGSTVPGQVGAIAGGGSAGPASVEIGATGRVTTTGDQAPAVIVEARAGNGGNASGLGAFAGAAGGRGGSVVDSVEKPSVSFLNRGVVNTTGQNAVAVVLQSVAGNGGSSSTWVGGAGGNAGRISGTNAGTIDTIGPYSFGIVAQSVGGSGGWGADGLFIAGDGGRAGTGGEIRIVNDSTGRITTHGIGSTAIVAQSVGGGAGLDAFQSQAILPNGAKPRDGVGTLDVTKGGGGDGGSAWGLFFARGGDGGTGGTGGLVSVDNRGHISTEGEAAYGILAQSIGGSGGAAGDGKAVGAVVAVAVGGRGGGGGNGGTVEIGSEAGARAYSEAKAEAVRRAVAALPAGATEEDVRKASEAATLAFSKSYADVSTIGKDAPAIIAQSIGGGGGMGGSSVAASAGPVLSVSVAVGGDGGKGGNGGLVDVWNTSAVSTAGAGSAGIQGQSIGGGGGSAGSARSYAVAIGAEGWPAIPISIAVGGSGGDGGDGGEVKLRNFSSVITTGAGSPAIDAMSIGGGGGSGGNAFSYALGIQMDAAPSIDINVAVGGSGGKGGKGGDVTVANGGLIRTSGTASDGVSAMSVGGGGGRAGDSRSVAGLMSFYANVAVPVTIGGKGGGGGAGGTVSVTNDGSIHTLGQFSNGIDASSIGGGGGKGGAADSVAEAGFGYEAFASDLVNSFASMLPTGKAVTANVTIGGSGGDGGSGGKVTVINNNSIRTDGTNSTGIAAYSIGGGGGSGGGFQGGGKGHASVNVRIGGSGGKGGDGGVVSVTNSAHASIETTQEGSHGIFVQSIGGGGGNGGTFTGKRKGAWADSFDPTALNLLDLGIKLVGEIGKANKGLRLAMADDIKQGKDESDEAFKQRQAAHANARGWQSGFDKGSTTQNTIEKASTVTDILKPLVAYMKIIKQIDEKQASKQGKTPAEIAKIDAEIRELDQKAALTGISFITGAAQTAFKDQIKDWSKKLGEAASKAKGDRFKGWEEKFPSVSVNVGVGGSGGDGGKGGSVFVYNYGSVSTAADMSYGVFAQSVGGGGGAGGGGFATGETQLAVNVSVGRNGAGGGDGGAVEVHNTYLIETRGAASFGLLAQSVGGGGGVGGASSAENAVSVSANVLVGGNSGASGNGGVVTVKNNGTITTEGKDSHALVAQSVGGGGGIFFNNLKSPRELELQRQEAAKKAAAATPEQSETQRQVQEAVALVTEFLGQVSGNGNVGLERWATILPVPSLNVNIGGDGGAGGSGGKVIVSHDGTIGTSGEGAFGIFAQSIGGGGGFGANASSAGFSADYTTGGKGGAAGNGGKVELTLGRKSVVSTKGDGAHAIFVQSIGGGGGYGGTAKRYLLPNTVNDSGASGTGGEIEIRTAAGGGASDMLVSAAGERAHGIFAQSLGGGGGYVASLIGATVADKSAAGRERTGVSGRGGKVTIDTVGTISATGKDSYGIYVQSGVQDRDGAIQKPGSEDIGGWLHINYVPARIGNDVSITHTGNITGGSGDGAAIRIDGGGNNEFANTLYRGKNTITIGEGSVVQALSGTAIRTSWGTDIVDNRGTIVGNVNLDGGYNDTNTFYNRASGIYRSASEGSSITLALPAVDQLVSSVRGQFYNAGAIDLGGVGTIGSASLFGHLTVETGGRLLVDISPAVGAGGPTSDRLSVSGNVKFDAGSQLSLNALTWLLPGRYTFLSATGNIEGTPAVTGVPQVAVPVTWTFGSTVPRSNGGGTDMWVMPQADFTHPSGITLTADQLAVANQLQAGWNDNALSMAPRFVRYLGIASAAVYAAALDESTPESSSYVAATKVATARASLKAALSCPAFEGAGTLLQEGECVWGRVGGSMTRMSQSIDEGGFRQNSLIYRAGGQKEFMPGWFVGASASFTQGDLKDPDGLTGFNTDSYDASVAIKYQTGAWLFALSGTVGNTFQNSQRALNIGGFSDIALGKARVLTAGVRLRGAYEFAFDDWYVRPYLDLDALHVRTPLVSEYGAPGFNLNVYGQTATLFSASPNVEIGGRFNIEGGYWLRPYGSIGFTILSGDSFATLASFVGDPLEYGAFRTTSRIPDKLFDIGLGLQVSAGTGFEFTAEYQSQLGRDFVSQGGTARFSWRF